MKAILTEVAAERERQDATWGVQNHSGPVWNLILQEEAGEVAEAVLNIGQWEGGGRYVFPQHHTPVPEGLYDEVRKELIQVAAVAVAWVEAIDRRPVGP